MIPKNLKPEKVLYFFKEICSIPHGSYNTKRIADYVVDFARKRNFEYSIDEYNNVVIRKPATDDCKSNDVVMIQGHLDMVCAKKETSEIDFEEDGLDLQFDGKYIYANGTTLGGDDGIAVAMALAVLDSDDIIHPELECVFTTDEEVGMLGANAMDMSGLKASYLLNVDSEDEGQFTVSCAGGETLVATFETTVSDEIYDFSVLIKISNLVGGHSGVEIDKGRANANILMGKILSEVSESTELQLVCINGGEKDNAIPVECEAVINVKDFEKFVLAYKHSKALIFDEYSAIETNMEITYEKIPFENGINSKVLNVLSNVTNGIRAMSNEIEGLVQTSSNLGIVRTEENKIVMTFSLRSSVAAEKKMLHDEIENLVIKNNGAVETFGSYPAWEFKKDSLLRELCKDIYLEQSGKEAEIVAIHAGLECGIFSDRIKNLDCVSFGPNLLDIHTVNERMEVESVERVFSFLIELLRRLSEQ